MHTSQRERGMYIAGRWQAVISHIYIPGMATHASQMNNRYSVEVKIHMQELDRFTLRTPHMHAAYMH